MRGSGSRSRVRQPAVAGSFYPADPERLRLDVSGLLAETPILPAYCRAKALIAPHAGYVYSGAVAARAFARLRGCPINRVVLIGPAHYVGFRGIATPRADAVATPLGEVPVDQSALAASAELPFVVQNDTAQRMLQSMHSRWSCPSAIGSRTVRAHAAAGRPS